MKELTEGIVAPEFTANDHNGNPVTLSSFRGKKVILYFYPKDNTPGCTAQACNLRDNYLTLTEQGFVVIGVSTDSENSHQKFIAKHELPFILVADTDKAVHELYGTWKEKSMYGRKYMGTARYTFVIDEKGVVSKIFTKVDTKNHTKQILDSMK